MVISDAYAEPSRESALGDEMTPKIISEVDNSTSPTIRCVTSPARAVAARFSLQGAAVRMSPADARSRSATDWRANGSPWANRPRRVPGHRDYGKALPGQCGASSGEPRKDAEGTPIMPAGFAEAARVLAGHAEAVEQNGHLDGITAEGLLARDQGLLVEAFGSPIVAFSAAAIRLLRPRRELICGSAVSAPPCRS